MKGRNMTKVSKINVEDLEISVLVGENQGDYICLTDMARYKDNDPALIISHWMRSLNTLDYLGAWETMHNPNFKPTEFGRFKTEAGYNAFTMSPKKWIEATGAIGIRVKPGRYGGGTFAHKDIAFNFGMWISPVFQLYVVKSYQTLVEQINNPLAIQWDAKRLLSKINYSVHTDAIKDHIIPTLPENKIKEQVVYAEEADLLNLAIFGCTAKQWEAANPILSKRGLNIRDTATINQLAVLSSIESMNAELIKLKKDKRERLVFLRKMAMEQLATLDKHHVEQRFQKLIEEANKPKAIE